MTLGEVYPDGGLATLGLMNLSRVIRSALKNVTVVYDWFPCMKTAN